MTRFRPLSIACGSFLLFTLVLTSTSAQTVRFGPPSGDRLRAAVESLPETVRSRLFAEAKQVFPVFIFVPGVMGSQLTRRIDGNPPEVIWGEGIVARQWPNLSYSESDKVFPSLLRTYTAGPFNIDVYDSAMKIIDDLKATYETTYDIYAYDWRQSNIKTAEGLTDWLCDPARRASLKLTQRPVVFLAHSMGGLVLKYWIKHEFNTRRCPGANEPISSWLHIKKIVFGGTPHYGSPKAITAFSESFYMFFDPSGVWRHLLGWSEQLLGPAVPINQYGATFPSAYQLLPVTSAECFPRGNGLPVAFKTDEGKSDIFNAALWTQYNWPVSLHSSVDRDAFHRTMPAYLTSAKAFLCDLSDFDVDRTFDVTRVVSASWKTICTVNVTKSWLRGRYRTTPEVCADGGDGTVPAWIAGQFDHADKKTLRWVTKDHAKLFSDEKFKLFLEEYYTELHAEWQRKLVEILGLEEVAELYAKVGYLIPSAPNQATEATVQAQINQIIVRDKLHLEPEQIYRAAKDTKRGAARSDGYRVYADLARMNPRTDPWALNNAAHINLGEKNFVAAHDLARRAIEIADSLKAPEARRIKAKAALTAGIAAQKIGDSESEKVLRQIAIQNGNSKARRFLQP